MTQFLELKMRPENATTKTEKFFVENFPLKKIQKKFFEKK